jgi:ketosteroid isomerase-like protein
MRFVLFFVVVALVTVGVPQAMGQSSPRSLQVGIPVEQSISGTDVHAYTFRAGANSTFAAVVLQKGVDLVVTLVAPDGQKVVEVDSPNGLEGPEPLSALIETAGTYRIEVRRLPDGYNPQSGIYEVRLETLRAATDAELHTHADIKALTTLEARWESALEKHDLAAVSALMADDFFYFQNSPGAADKATHLASLAEQYKRDGEVVETHTISDRTIKVFGDTAVAGGGATIKVQRTHGTTMLPGRFMHVWQRRDGGWRLVADHFYVEGSEPRPRTEVTLSPAELERLAGVYELVDGVQFTISVDNGGLTARQTRPAEPWALPLVAESPNEFFSKVGDYQLVFVRNGGAIPDRFMFFVRGRAIRGERVPVATSK